VNDRSWRIFGALGMCKMTFAGSIPFSLESLLLLLLPVAAASGWYTAQRSFRKKKPSPLARPIRVDYFQGIHYLLYEQPDKAIEAFIKVLEVADETAETHLALGNLYRRRGEMERAIRMASGVGIS